jgi:NAD-dependent deacetylase
MAKVIILSGAGISAESGISTFRDEDGLWENHNIEDICTSGCLDINRKNTIKFYDMLRVNLKDKQPNHAHIVVSQLKNKYPNEIAIITQNVDDMFERAGCKDILHLHGFLQELRCEKCNTILNIKYEEQFEKHENCPNCNNLLRPNIVFFGENAPKYENMYKEFDDCEVFVVIGTSGAVIYTDMFLNPQIKLSILNNLQESPFINDTVYSKVLYKKATLAIDEIASDIEKYLEFNLISSYK